MSEPAVWAATIAAMISLAGLVLSHVQWRKTRKDSRAVSESLRNFQDQSTYLSRVSQAITLIDSGDRMAVDAGLLILEGLFDSAGIDAETTTSVAAILEVYTGPRTGGTEADSDG